MTFAGIDLSSDPRRTGVAVLDDDGSRISVRSVRVGADDGDVSAVVRTAHAAGVDVPFGWPEPFVALLAAQAQGQQPAGADQRWRHDLVLRTTDHHVWERTGLRPLSVSTDRIAFPAMRWAGIEAELRDSGIDMARDGSGRVCEVYPAAALQQWGLSCRGYKGGGNDEARAAIVEGLSRVIDDLDWQGSEPQCIADDNALDAVVAALVAREVGRGRAVGPPSSLAARARREGWIWIPTRSSAGPPGQARNRAPARGHGPTG